MATKATTAFPLHLALLAAVLDGRSSATAACNGSAPSCDFFHGSWAFNDSYPLYDSAACPFIDPEFDCLKYGRPDKLYIKYRWLPPACQIPRFDGKEFLRRWRKKKVMFVGDSLSNNQWESLLCMLHASVPGGKTYTNRGIPCLLSRSSWDYIQDGNKIEGHDGLDAFSKGLTSWAKWVESKVDINTKRVFIQGISPNHYLDEEWGSPGGMDCRKQMQPVLGSTYPGGAPPEQGVVKRVLSNLSKPVYLLDITLFVTAEERCTPIGVQWGPSWDGLQPLVHCWASRYVESDPLCSSPLMQL